MTAPLPRPRVSLRVRWTAALLALGAAPLVALSVITLRLLHDGLEAAEEHLEVAAIDRATDTLSNDLNAAADATLRVGRALTEARISPPEARIDLARQSLAEAPGLASVAIYGTDRRLIDTLASTRATQAPAPPEALDALIPNPSAEGAWLHFVSSNSGPVLRFVAAVERDGVPRAWLVGTLSPTLLPERLTEISRRHFGRPGCVLLTDDHLRLVSHSGGALASGADLSRDDIFARVAVAARSDQNQFGFSTEYVSQGVAMVGTVRTWPAHGWLLSVRRPQREAYTAIVGAQRALAVVALTIVAMALVAGAWLARRTTRPIEALVSLTDAYARREFASRSTVHTGDELEMLGGAMERMADAIARDEIELGRRAKVEAALARYLPAEVARGISEGRGSITLGGERRTVSVLFADVVAFTSFAERAPPERVVAFLNELFTTLTEVVFRHDGIVDKFMGDCVMAIFGAPTAHPDHAAMALRAAEDMHRFVEANAPLWKNSYGVEVKLGIGVHSGEALLGNLGSEQRMEYTAIGDAVNIAARLEALASPGRTLVTQAVVDLAGDGFDCVALGTKPLRGRAEPVAVFEVAE